MHGKYENKTWICTKETMQKRGQCGCDAVAAILVTPRILMSPACGTVHYKALSYKVMRFKLMVIRLPINYSDLVGFERHVQPLIYIGLPQVFKVSGTINFYSTQHRRTCV